MKAIHLAQVKLLKISPFWLLATAAGLIAIHLTLNWRAEKPSHLAISIVYWLAASSMLWDKRKQLKLGSGIFSLLLGALLIAGVLLKSASHPGVKFLGFSPFVSALGIALLASGFQGLKQYRQELIILFSLGVPRILLPHLPDISPITAKFSAFLLWYTGFDISLQGINIVLPNGGVEVVPSCSGLNLITYMLGLSVVFLVMFPSNLANKIVAPVVAATLGFAVNGVRIALLAVLSTNASRQAFEYWHSKEGTLIFVMISVVLFGFFCLFLLPQEAEGERGIGGSVGRQLATLEGKRQKAKGKRHSCKSNNQQSTINKQQTTNNKQQSTPDN